MCITVERAEIRLLNGKLNGIINGIRDTAPSRAQDPFMALDPSAAIPMALFRDFPKTHGNIIQHAVGIALKSHLGGLSEVQKRFSFLSGCQIEIDNFFVSRHGKIYLIESKRQIDTVRDSSLSTAVRSLAAVSNEIKTAVSSLGQTLKHNIECCVYSHADKDFPSARYEDIEIGDATNPNKIKICVLSRTDMNNLIGPCFGIWMTYVDDIVARCLKNATEHICVSPESLIDNNPLCAPMSDVQEDTMLIGESACDDLMPIELFA